MVQIEFDQIWIVVSGIIISLFVYFIRLEIRVRKVEELESKFTLESRLSKLESDPVFNTLKQLNINDSFDLYKKSGGGKI